MPAIIRPRNANGSFGEPKKFGKGETDKQKIARLEIEAALLAYEGMQKDTVISKQHTRIDELETSQALLTYQLMAGGVL